MTVTNVRCTISGFSKALNEILEDYSQESLTGVREAVDSTAKLVAADTRKSAKETFPVKKSQTITGAYAKGWANKLTDDGRLSYSRTVYNRYGGLPHLLENGHGGPHPARDYPHITSDETTEEIFARELEKALQ